MRWAISASTHPIPQGRRITTTNSRHWGGVGPFIASGDEFAFRPAGGKPGTFLLFCPTADPGDYGRDRIGLQHLAFMVKTRSAVERVHQFAPRAGGEVLHEQQSCPRYPPLSFATLWHEPVRDHAGSGVPPRRGLIVSGCGHAPNQLGAVANYRIFEFRYSADCRAK